MNYNYFESAHTDLLRPKTQANEFCTICSKDTYIIRATSFFLVDTVVSPLSLSSSSFLSFPLRRAAHCYSVSSSSLRPLVILILISLLAQCSLKGPLVSPSGAPSNTREIRIELNVFFIKITHFLIFL